jgi:hypothetical protein
MAARENVAMASLLYIVTNIWYIRTVGVKELSRFRNVVDDVELIRQMANDQKAELNPLI